MLNYTRKGSGDVLVLIHGLLGSISIFDKIIDPLTDRFDVIAFDLPGHGKSDIENEDIDYTMYRYAEEIVDVLVAEKVDKSYWVGHSMGGYITLAAIEKQYTQIEKAILLYSSDAPDSAEAIEKRTKQQQEILESGVGSFVDGIIHNFLAPNAKTEDILFAKEVAYDGKEQGLVAALGAMKSRPDQRDLVDKTSTPILIIEGEQDNVVTPIETSNPQVNKVKTNTGHLGMVEDPQNVLKEMLNFLEK
ncbi:alpha/beta hydrolase [Lysinibacillus sp. 2017]|uniref:alpha/beta fold hydrolase n=1 Tax=unclassified Lysinibacillus TaxID=2636778 RepID=UPI000D529934|nr:MULTISPECIES: alpha/beta hydrolase [unclassified Lysinibacillus]AWE07539.1 alpha/beta hydrolase [Lysinibacillus sp. 2017]TGN36702.1 alpha/beta hydrolase [Lysinibacillus sp. S2017]